MRTAFPPWRRGDQGDQEGRLPHLQLQVLPDAESRRDCGRGFCQTRREPSKGHPEVVDEWSWVVQGRKSKSPHSLPRTQILVVEDSL